MQIPLALLGCLLTLVENSAAGPVYAAHGAVYIAASIVWMWLAEGVRPDRCNLAGVAVCLFGAAIILAAPRAAD